MADKPHLNLIDTGSMCNNEINNLWIITDGSGGMDEVSVSILSRSETRKGDTFKYAWVMDSPLRTKEREVLQSILHLKSWNLKVFLHFD